MACVLGVGLLELRRGMEIYRGAAPASVFKENGVGVQGGGARNAKGARGLSMSVGPAVKQHAKTAGRRALGDISNKRATNTVAGRFKQDGAKPQGKAKPFVFVDATPKVVEEVTSDDFEFDTCNRRGSSRDAEFDGGFDLDKALHVNSKKSAVFDVHKPIKLLSDPAIDLAPLQLECLDIHADFALSLEDDKCNLDGPRLTLDDDDFGF